jgi:hypothetical protein
VVVRRLLTALLLATWLLGVAQPAFAVSRTDCCPTGSTSGCAGTCEPVRWAGASCCTTQASASFPVSLRARSEQAQPHGSGSQVTANLAVVDSFLRKRPAWRPLPRVVANTVFDESLTYLRTARLRL